MFMTILAPFYGAADAALEGRSTNLSADVDHRP
jgi:hypothetical protein